MDSTDRVDDTTLAGTEQATVLIVDDERDLADLYTAWLQCDHDIVTAYDGETALDLLTAEVDVVLLDRRMPDLTGDDVLAEIRDRGLDCRVAMVTAVEPDVDIIEMGFDDYVTKPVDEDQINRVVDRLLGIRAYDDLLRDHFAVATKLAALEAGVDRERLDANEEYAALVERFESIDRDARAHLESLMDDAAGDRLFGLFSFDRDRSTPGKEFEQRSPGVDVD